MTDWCVNCLEAPATERVRGYDVCEQCAVQAALAPHLRGNQ